MDSIVVWFIATSISTLFFSYSLRFLSNKGLDIFEKIQVELGQLSTSLRFFLQSGGFCLAIFSSIFLSMSLGGGALSAAIISGLLCSLVDFCFKTT